MESIFETAKRQIERGAALPILCHALCGGNLFPIITKQSKLKPDTMETKYTSGKWSATNTNAKDGAIPIQNEAGVLVAYASDNMTETREETGANARLIAAAPELLEALQEFVDYLDSDLSEAEAILKQRAETLITKATQP